MVPLTPLVRRRLTPAIAVVIVAVAGCRTTREPVKTVSSATADAGAPEPKIFDDETPTGRLEAFNDDAEIKGFISAWKQREDERQRKAAHPMAGPDKDAGLPTVATATATNAPVQAQASAASPAPAHARASAKGDASESITNNQHAGVDEGDIVKLHGDHLIVLRRGRLFTISLAAGGIQKSAMIDAFGPSIDPSGSWYDEMLVEGNDVVVIGFSYQRGGTEIGLFNIDDAGKLAYRATYHLRSNDYYSARNYASRIVDGRLVFYAPQYISTYDTDPIARFPAVRRWRTGATESDFVRTLAPKRLYRMMGELPTSGYAAMHTVTSCDLRAASLSCESVGLIGPAGRVFYVSPSNVYVWMRDWSWGADGMKRNSGMLAKIPIKPGSEPTAMHVAGMPTDQFSFEEDAGWLNVLVRAESNGDAMFASEATAGDAAILRVPLALFSDGVPTASRQRYRKVPRPDGYVVQNRFVGSWLLYGAGQGYWGQHKGGGQLYAVRYATDPASRAAGDDAKTIQLAQGVDRIEPMGDDAVVIGSRDTDLLFSPIALGADAAERTAFVRKNASQGELRSHGFFYKPSSEKGDGIIGLPIRSEGAHGASYLLEGSASVLFLANHGLALSELGALEASALRTNHDGCRASCVDWYGNARPIFATGRIFALLGYDLVEGRLDGAHIRERSRLSFAPAGGPPALSFD